MGRFDSRKFELELPENWRDATIYSFAGPEDRGIKHSLLVTIDEEPDTNDLSSYSKDRISILMKALEGAEVLKEGPFELASGLEGYEVVYKWLAAGDKPLFQRQVWVLADGYGYNFTASFSKTTLKTIGQEVDEIIGSFVPGESQVKDSGSSGRRFLMFGKKLGKGPKKPKKPAVKKPQAKKPVVKKPAVRNPAAKKPTVKKPRVRRP